MLPTVRLLIAALVLACVGVVTSTSPAQACPCTATSVERDAERADVVFSGVVVDQTARSGSRGTTSYRVEPETLYKGDVSRTRVRVTSPANDECGLGDLQVDERYVFFVTESGADLATDRCAGTGPAGDRLVRLVEETLGAGTDLSPREPAETEQAEFTRLEDAEPERLSRLAAPGVALVLVGVLGLLVVSRRSRRA
ncbi:hypothetical protein ACFP3Q_05875 [Nocardioides sp. GCM10027113]|uniref:hypothetical protein n=1 Tax=unclassified Nocardioides TaxID=2615069 RepID=UPI00360C6BA4